MPDRDADRAAAEAGEALQRQHSAWELVLCRVRRMKELAAENHFAERIQRAFDGRGD